VERLDTLLLLVELLGLPKELILLKRTGRRLEKGRESQRIKKTSQKSSVFGATRKDTTPLSANGTQRIVEKTSLHTKRTHYSQVCLT
jgi:hypothetical protein